MKRRRGTQRAGDQARSLAREIALARATAGLSMASAAGRAGIARSTWERVEHGDAGIALTTLCAAAGAVGLDVVIHGYPGKGSSPRDRGQLAIARYLARIAHESWNGSLEVTAGDHGQAIDQVFWRPEEIVAIEIVRHLRDYQGQYRSFSLKRDWLARHHQRPVRLILAVEDLRSNRAAVAPHIPLIRSVLPAGSRWILAALRSGQPLGSDGLLWVRRPA